MDNCIFCKIQAGDIPAAKIYENEHVLAFLDISQVTKGHTLIIPKTHVKNVFELTPEIASEVFKAVPIVSRAIQKAFKPVALNILNNNGELAGQSVFHFHLHLLPRYDVEDGFNVIWHPNEGENLKEIADSIVKEL